MDSAPAKKASSSADDNEIVELLKANLEAQNRTTHAVRAYARFVLIQALTALIASPMIIWGASAPLPILVFLGAIVALIGSIWSLSAGWTELGLSNRIKMEELKSDLAATTRLQENFASLGTLEGKTYEAISAVVGPPNFANELEDGHTQAQWSAPAYQVLLRFDQYSVCSKVVHKTPSV